MEAITKLEDIFARFDAAVLDIWGVLHDGVRAYPAAIAAITALTAAGKPVGVLSNSSRRAAPNLQHLTDLGFPVTQINQLLSSGEVLYQDLAACAASLGADWPLRVYPLARDRATADSWCAQSGNIRACARVEDAEALLLLSSPATAKLEDYRELLNLARAGGLKLICANLDLISISGTNRGLGPGAVALHYQQLGGEVIYYGKPHERVFQSMQDNFDGVSAERILMVGDSLLHDIAGSQQLGWQSLFVRSGVHASELSQANASEAQLEASVERIIQRVSVAHWPPARLPTYTIDAVR